MTQREWNIIKEAVTRTRYELDNKAAPPGPDSWRGIRPPKVTWQEGAEIREYVRASVKGDQREMRKFGNAA